MKSVLVIGDIIADVYRDCFFKKMCPDAPTVKAVVEQLADVRPGGAANVAVNLASLAPNTRITLIGVVDVRLARAIKQASYSRVDMSHCVFADEAFTKERIIVDNETVIRVDNGLAINGCDADKIESELREYLKSNNPDLIILSDYGARSINKASMDMLLDVRERLLVDTKLTDLSIFGSNGRKTRLVKLNLLEWGSVIKSEAAPERFFHTMVVTQGGRGANMMVYEELGQNKSQTHVLKAAGHNVYAVDVCGCGDTFLAGLTASLLSSNDDFTALQFANAASATVVIKSRTAVADLELTLELLNRK